MQSNNSFVIIGCVAYPLSLYPHAYVEKAEELFGDVAAHLEAYELTPETCPADLIPLYDGLRLVNGEPVREPVWHLVGSTLDRIDLDENGQWSVWDVEGHEGDAMAIMTAYAWSTTFAQGDWHVRFREPSPVSPVCEVLFGFDSAEDEVAFVSKMTCFFNSVKS